MMCEEEEEETLFDQEGLLGGGKKSSCDREWIKRFSKTLSLSLAFFALGLCISVPGATLPDLEERTHSSTEHISLIFTARSLGYLLGSIIGGVLFDYFDQQILLFYTLVMTGIATIAVPWCTALVALACMIAVQGLALGVLDTGGNMFCIKIWSKSSAPYMQGLHFSFAIGAFLAPLLARPFLVGEAALNASNTVYSVREFPLSVRLLELSGRGGGEAEGNRNHLKRSADMWRMLDSELDRVLRAAENDTTDRVINTSTEVDTTVVLSTWSKTANLTTKKTVITTPSHFKPAAADAAHLNDVYADGVKAKKKILEHKNDERPIENNPAQRTSTQPSFNQTNMTAEGKNDSLLNQSESEGTRNLSLGTSEVSSSSSQFSSSEGIGSEYSSVDLQNTSAVSFFTTTSSTTLKSTSITTITSTNTVTSSLEKSSNATIFHPVVKEEKPESKTSPVTNSIMNSTFTSSTPLQTTISRKFKPEILDVITSTIDAMKNMSKIQFAYMIIGLILLGDAVLFLGLYWKDCRAGTLLHQVSALGPSTPSTSFCFRVSVLSLLFVFFLMYVGIEVAFGGLITTFAVESELIKWNRPQGATLAALFWGSIAVGRGMGIFIARCFKPPCMLVTDLIFMLAGSIVLSFCLKATPIMLWVGTVTLGFGMSSVFPTAVSWADCYYPLTGRAAAVFITGSGIGEMVIPVVTGYLFQNVSSLWLMYVVLSFSILLIVVFICLQSVAAHHPRPIPASKLGFMPLHNEDENSLHMDDLVNGSTGYTESSRRRQIASKHIEVAEEETTKLVDFSD